MVDLVVASPQSVVKAVGSLDLNSILDGAPAEVSCEERDNGFDLENNTLKINYVVADFDSLTHVVNLWFMNTYPIVVIKGSYVGGENGGEPPLYCWDLAIIDQHNGFKCEHVQRGEGLPFVPVGEEDWFMNAGVLLSKAEEKYGLRQRIEDYLKQRYDGQEPDYEAARLHLVRGVSDKLL